MAGEQDNRLDPALTGATHTGDSMTATEASVEGESTLPTEDRERLERVKVLGENYGKIPVDVIFGKPTKMGVGFSVDEGGAVSTALHTTGGFQAPDNVLILEVSGTNTVVKSGGDAPFDKLSQSRPMHGESTVVIRARDNKRTITLSASPGTSAILEKIGLPNVKAITLKTHAVRDTDPLEKKYAREGLSVSISMDDSVQNRGRGEPTSTDTVEFSYDSRSGQNVDKKWQTETNTPGKYDPSIGGRGRAQKEYKDHPTDTDAYADILDHALDALDAALPAAAQYEVPALSTHPDDERFMEQVKELRRNAGIEADSLEGQEPSLATTESPEPTAQVSPGRLASVRAALRRLSHWKS